MGESRDREEGSSVTVWERNGQQGALKMSVEWDSSALNNYYQTNQVQ